MTAILQNICQSLDYAKFSYFRHYIAMDVFVLYIENIFFKCSPSHVVPEQSPLQKHEATPASTRHDPSFRQDKLSHGETRKYKKMLLKME